MGEAFQGEQAAPDISCRLFSGFRSADSSVHHTLRVACSTILLILRLEHKLSEVKAI